MPGAFPQWRNCGEKFAQRIATLTFSAPGLYYSISTRFHGAYVQLFRLLHSARVSNSYFPALPAVLSSYTLRTFHRLCDDRFVVILLFLTYRVAVISQEILYNFLRSATLR